MTFFIPFLLKDQWFGVEAVHVKQVSRYLPITKVPNTPSFVEGVINVHGKVIPTIDLRKRLNFSENKIAPRDRILLIQMEQRLVGYWVDEVANAISLDPKNITAADHSSESGFSEYVSGSASWEDRAMQIIDLTKVLSTSEKQKLGAAS